ncbi:MAG TPA: hypothetical protein VFR18_23905 [Terriglobia bacterium]|nr:hypothetical protein [Terriglobia bacterium]
MSLTISLTPDEVEQCLAALHIECRFTAAERVAYATTPVVKLPERLFAYPVPSDSSLLTLSNIKDRVGTDPKRPPSFFDNPWYQSEQFMSTRCTPGWHILSMEPISGSLQQPVDYLRSNPELELPQAVEVVLMLFLHFVHRGEQLLFKKHSWCSDMASLNRHVTVGAFGRNGVFLSAHPSNFSSQGLGVCAKIRLPGDNR